jgi:hypothetical protein
VMTQFTGNHPINKVCFHRKEKLKMPACIYIPSKIEDMGNLYSQYQRFVGRFDFAKWILGVYQDSDR